MPYLPLPPPIPFKESEAFWAGCKRHELVIRRCADCGIYHHPPLPICPECRSWRHTWARMSGKGRVESFTIVRRALFPGFPLPYNIVRVELEEQKGLILLGNLINCEPGEIHVSMPVRIVFEDLGDKSTMYYFEKAP
jgi:uncharacterized OB-fold protein